MWPQWIPCAEVLGDLVTSDVHCQVHEAVFRIRSYIQLKIMYAAIKWKNCHTPTGKEQRRWGAQRPSYFWGPLWGTHDFLWIKAVVQNWSVIIFQLVIKELPEDLGNCHMLGISGVDGAGQVCLLCCHALWSPIPESMRCSPGCDENGGSRSWVSTSWARLKGMVDAWHEIDCDVMVRKSLQVMVKEKDLGLKSWEEGSQSEQGGKAWYS